MMNVAKLQLLPTGSQAVRDGGASGADSAFSAEIQAELQRVLLSTHFDASPRNRRFLEYVVEETLAGRAARIKAYNIATEVFGRDDSFNPQLDPVVRMEARRLRRSLERFYLVETFNGSVKIAMPKGAYVPTFESNRAPQVSASICSLNISAPASAPYGRSIFLPPFEVEGDRQSRVSYNDGLVRQIAVGLSKFPEISVYTSTSPCAQTLAAATGSPTVPADLDFILTGNTASDLKELTATIALLNARDGRVVWGETFEENFAATGILHARDRIADRIVRALAEQCDAAQRDESDGEEIDRSRRPFESLVHFHQYRRWLRPDLFHLARERLQQTAVACPTFAEAIACLSLVHSDGYRFGFVPADSFSRKAAEFARKAVDLSPRSYRSHHAQGIVHWLSGDADAGLESLETAYALNPHVLDTMADLGLHLCLLGEWTKGVPLVEKALAESPVQAGFPRLALSLYYFAQGQFERALAEATQIGSPHLAHGFLAKAICLRRLGRHEEAARTAARGVQINPQLLHEFLFRFAAGNIPLDLTNEIKSAFHDTG